MSWKKYYSCDWIPTEIESAELQVTLRTFHGKHLIFETFGWQVHAYAYNDTVFFLYWYLGGAPVSTRARHTNLHPQ